jgi:hypothetical protein
LRSGWHVDRIALDGPLALGLPVAGLAVVVASTLLVAHGPDVLAGNWAGRSSLELVGFLGYALVLVSGLRYESAVVFLGSCLLLGAGTAVIQNAVEEHVLAGRGDVTACIVRDVERRVETHTDSEGHTHTEVFYDYRVACDDPEVREFTTWRKVAEDGESLDVRYDPVGRLDPRPAELAGSLCSSMSVGLLLFAAGMALRALYDFGFYPLRSGI